LEQSLRDAELHVEPFLDRYDRRGQDMPPVPGDVRHVLASLYVDMLSGAHVPWRSLDTFLTHYAPRARDTFLVTCHLGIEGLKLEEIMPAKAMNFLGLVNPRVTLMQAPTRSWCVAWRSPQVLIETELAAHDMAPQDWKYMGEGAWHTEVDEMGGWPAYEYYITHTDDPSVGTETRRLWTFPPVPPDSDTDV
jgi:hypothetical protein